jgi:hypothetical protein
MKGAGRVAVTLAVFAGLSLAAAAAAAQQGSAERPFAAGGQVRMDLSAGDYTIQAGRDDRILVQWDTRSADDAARVKVDIQRQGSAATITTKGPHNSFRVLIELPARAHLHVDLSAGNLRVRGISGNKDLGSWAGNIDVEIGRGEDYARIDTAVKAGEINARPLNVSKGGLFRSFTWKGPGQHTLRVRLTAGNLRLLQ